MLGAHRISREHLQDGVLRGPGAMDNVQRALHMGVHVVGGIPHFERTSEQGASGCVNTRIDDGQSAVCGRGLWCRGLCCCKRATW